jgi:hypothetical protein
LLFESSILTGKREGDEMLSWDDPKKYRTKEMTTPAGSFSVKPNRGDQKALRRNYAVYNYNLLPLVDERGNETIFAIHQIPIGANGRTNSINKSASNKRMTNGCINTTEKSFKEIEKHIVGCKIHVLPDDSDGKFIVRDGLLKFYYGDKKIDHAKFNITPASVASMMDHLFVSHVSMQRFLHQLALGRSLPIVILNSL